MDLNQLQALLESQSVAPVERWQPQHCGRMDLLITRDGRWVHQGSEIKRAALVKLFSTILRRDGDDYFLVTPEEKLRIQVEDAPFVLTAVSQVADPTVAAAWLVFTTNVGDLVRLDSTHPLRIETEPVTATPKPYLTIRANLTGLLQRPVFYQLVNWGTPTRLNGREHLILSSGDSRFDLGATE